LESNRTSLHQTQGGSQCFLLGHGGQRYLRAVRSKHYGAELVDREAAAVTLSDFLNALFERFKIPTSSAAG